MQVKSVENDSQTKELIDKLFETNHFTVNAYPNVSIVSSGDKLHYHKVQLALRYYVSKRAMEMNYFFMFYSFHDECELKVGQPLSYASKLSKPGILEIINNNKCLLEPDSDLANNVFLNREYKVDISSSWGPFSQQENRDFESELREMELNEEAEIICESDVNQNNQKQSRLNFIQHFLVRQSD